MTVTDPAAAPGDMEAELETFRIDEETAQTRSPCHREGAWACSENPPKTRSQKPNNDGDWPLEKWMFRICWFSEREVPNDPTL
jgi:hypothetical protein